MKTITMQPAPGGWVVESEFTGCALPFLRPEDAERKAYELGQLAASLGMAVQVLVRDPTGFTVASAVLGPGRGSPRLRPVHPAR